MRVLVQRVLESNVKVKGRTVGLINQGLLIFVCLEKDDTESVYTKMAQKVLNLRIFEDEDGKMNQKITQINQGKILSISQFTLSWPGKKGNRPSFTNSMNPTTAEIYYTKFNILLEKETQIETGIFGEDMKVSLINDGPVTFMLES